MTKSRHFANTIRRTRSAIKDDVKIEVKKEIIDNDILDNATFESDMKKFDSQFKPNKITKSKSVSKKRVINHIKLESEINIEHPEPQPQIPDNFFPMYNKIKEMRKLIVTPVDLIGCSKIPGILKYITNEFRKNGEIVHILLDDLNKIHDDVVQIENDSQNIDIYWRFHLLVTLLFSSQTKDEINFQVMEFLHTHYLEKGYSNGLCIQAIRDTDVTEIDKMIFKIGFHSRKSQYLKEVVEVLHSQYNDDIPDTIEELVKLKGIGNKMGHLILQGAWNKIVGISVDTHMVRLCNMFHWLPSKKIEKNPDNVRKELESMLIDHKEMWNEINPVLVGFGQSVCTPVGRRCDLCLLSKINEKNDVLCPAIDKKLLLRINRGVENTSERKIRGDLQKLIDYINS